MRSSFFDFDCRLYDLDDIAQNFVPLLIGHYMITTENSNFSVYKLFATISDLYCIIQLG